MEVNETGLLSLLGQHLAWYPRMQVQDAYKLIFQATMGPEHLLVSGQDFTRHLAREFELLTPERDGRLLEPVRPDASLLRLNLRPYKHLQTTIDRLIPPLLQTAETAGGNKAALLDAWAIFSRLGEAGVFSAFANADVRNFSHHVEQGDYPVVHHSQVYRDAYHPAYRLISAQFVPQLGLDNR